MTRVRVAWLLPLLGLCLAGLAGRGLSILFKREDPPYVAAGNDLFAKGKFDEALRAYEDAQRELGPSAELAFDRGNALFKLGRSAEAREAYLTALTASDSKLKAQDYYNMGNALWELEKKDEAAQSYERSLLLDPNLEAARHNLALLLAPPPQPDAGQTGREARATVGPMAARTGAPRAKERMGAAPMPASHPHPMAAPTVVSRTRNQTQGRRAPMAASSSHLRRSRNPRPMPVPRPNRSTSSRPSSSSTPSASGRRIYSSGSSARSSSAPKMPRRTGNP